MTGHLPEPRRIQTHRGHSQMVETVPSDAIVALSNGGPPYEPGMRLAPGRYVVSVSAPGYSTQWEVVEHGTADTVRRIVLREHESPAPTPDGPPEPELNSEPRPGFDLLMGYTPKRDSEP